MYFVEGGPEDGLRPTPTGGPAPEPESDSPNQKNNGGRQKLTLLSGIPAGICEPARRTFPRIPVGARAPGELSRIPIPAVYPSGIP
ncbi:hypothetical protein PGTUg99_008497 [Puccinia graminis f. sp. tritici]|uniref:Uncharacterized protein n=1 Tax=Puccinia graminis f. sp. tritici TaxID=56615 RepID=A0A5B0SDL5_PUCGR|nr:hypothetical protein PGTUg99_008497 [Puccinia graminis f. sp. tritici]